MVLYDPFARKDLKTNNATTAVLMQHLYSNRVIAWNGFMQPIARQLQQLDYNNGNESVFYVVSADELS
jgi:hypothetical protein